MAKKKKRKPAGHPHAEAHEEPKLCCPPEPGDLVTLDMPNAPQMTVLYLTGPNRALAQVRWFDQIGALYEREFHLDELVSAEEETKGQDFDLTGGTPPAPQPGSGESHTSEPSSTTSTGAADKLSTPGHTAAKATHEAEKHGGKK